MDSEGRNATNPWRMPLRAWRAVAWRAWNESSDDNIGLIAAGVAFYGFLAIVPLLGSIVLFYGIFVQPATVIRHIQTLTEIMPPDVARGVGEQLLTVAHASDGKKGLGALLALGIALFGARNGAGAIITALNIAYEEKEKRNILWLNLTALAITAGAVVVAMVAAVAVTTLRSITQGDTVASDAVLLSVSLFTYVLMTLGGAAGAAALYRFGPSRQKAQWAWLTPGSLLAALLWLGLTLGFGAYVAHIGKFDATYGPLGAVAALLTWLYLSSYVLLFGAELNSELEHQTAEDTTTGAPQPMGERRAWVADHVADELALPAPPAPTSAAATASVPAPAPPPTLSGQSESFIAARVAVRSGRLAGIPKIGWISSVMASLGLAMLRRRGRQAAGAALLAGAAGISLLRAKD